MATLVLDNTLYQGYATIAEQNPKYQWLYINAMEDLQRRRLFVYS